MVPPFTESHKAIWFWFWVCIVLYSDFGHCNPYTDMIDFKDPLVQDFFFGRSRRIIRKSALNKVFFRNFAWAREKEKIFSMNSR